MSGREGQQEQQNCPFLLLTRAVPSSEAPNFTGWAVLQILGLKTLKNPGRDAGSPEVGWVGLEPGKGCPHPRTLVCSNWKQFGGEM